MQVPAWYKAGDAESRKYRDYLSWVGIESWCPHKLEDNLVFRQTQK